jgi:hypothetical protein
MLSENCTIKISDQHWILEKQKLSEMGYFSALFRSSFKDSKAIEHTLDYTLFDKEAVRSAFQYLDNGILFCNKERKLSKIKHFGADWNPHWRLLGKIYAVAQFLCYDTLLNHLRRDVMQYLDHFDACKVTPCRNIDYIPNLYMAFYLHDEDIEKRCWKLLKKWWYLGLGAGWSALIPSIRNRLISAITITIEDSNAFQLLEEWMIWNQFLTNPKAARYRSEMQGKVDEMKLKLESYIGQKACSIWELDPRLTARITSQSWCDTEAMSLFLSILRERSLKTDCVPITMAAYQMLQRCMQDESSELFLLLDRNFHDCLQFTTKRWFNIADQLFHLPKSLIDAITADQKITQEDLRVRAKILRNSRKIPLPKFPIK